MPTNASDVIQTAASLMREAEGLNTLERDLQMSAIYEYLARAATDLKTFHPDAHHGADQLADYAQVVAAKARLSRTLGNAQDAAVDAAKGIGVAFLKQPSITALAASGPVTIVLYWMDVLQGIGEGLGRLAATTGVMLAVLSGGALVWVARYLWMAATQAANATGRGLDAVTSAPHKVRANLRELDRALTELMSAQGRRVVEPPIFKRARTFVAVVGVTACVSVGVAGIAGWSGLVKGHEEACRAAPTSKLC